MTHVFTIHNAGPTADRYALEVQLPAGWKALPVPKELEIPAGGKDYVFVNIIVPSEALAEEYRITLIVTSLTQPTVRAQAVALVRVLPQRDFVVEWMRRPPDPQVGRDTTGVLRVMNTGNVPDSYRVEVTAPAGWDHRVSPGKFDLLPGEGRLVKLTLVVPRTAEPGANYVVRIEIASQKGSGLIRSLSLSGRVLPPPPEEVGGSLFPSWEVSGTVSLEAGGGPVLSLQGWGDIVSLGFFIDSRLDLAVTGPRAFRLSWAGRGWSFHWDHGSITGVYLGVSGKPLIGGELAGRGSFRVLLDPDSLGVGAEIHDEKTWIGIALGYRREDELSFQELTLRRTFAEDLSGWAYLSRAIQAGTGGYAWGIGGAVPAGGGKLEVAYHHIGAGYPHQTPRDTTRLSWTTSGGGLELSWEYTAVVQTPSSHLFSNDLRASLGLPVPLRPHLVLSYGRRWDESIPKSTDEERLGARGSLSAGTWSASLDMEVAQDRVSGTTTFSQGFRGGLVWRLGEAELRGSMGLRSVTSSAGTEVSSRFSLEARFLGIAGEPRVSLEGGGGKSVLSLEITDLPLGEGRFSWSWKYSMGEESRWTTQLSLELPADFPFCGPVKGRIIGRVFLDRDGDGIFGPGDRWLEGILLEADGYLAVSGKGGRFVFPPLDPGTYRIRPRDLPVGLVLGGEPPLVKLAAGMEEEILVPLVPRSWLKAIVFLDRDGDGVRDPGEPGFAGARILVSGRNGELVLRSDETGYAMGELPPGIYRLKLDTANLPPRYRPTTPTEVEVSVPQGGVATAYFGVRLAPKPVVVTFAPPQAAFTYSPMAPRAGEQVRFSGAESRAINARIVDYRWEFRLGERHFTARGEEVTVVFPVPGRWEVILTVTDSNGLVAATRGTVEVRPSG